MEELNTEEIKTEESREENTVTEIQEQSGNTETPENEPEKKKEGRKNWKFVLGLLTGILVSLIAFFLWRGYFTIPIPAIGLMTVKLPTYGLFGNSENGLDQEELNRKLEEINYYLENEYYYDQKKEDLVDAAVDGVYSEYTSEDHYSDYYTREEYLQEIEDNQGSFVGIGVYVMKDEATGGVLVVKPLKGGPALEAGIRAGDVIIESDGVDLCSLDIETATGYIKGEEGTEAELVILRDGKTIEMTVERRMVNSETVYSSVIENEGKKYGYIYVSSFVVSTYETFLDAVDEMCLQDVSGIIVDLRDNTGGDMNVCLNMADYILPDHNGTFSGDDEETENRGRTRLLTLRSKNGNQVHYYANDTHEINIPLVVLVNGYSASASEIFAGIMRSYGCAICGTTTYGKGIVQSVRMLYDMSGIKYTSGEYVLPDGSRIHGIGIEPDRIVEPSDELKENGADAENPDPEEDNMLAEALRLIGEKS